MARTARLFGILLLLLIFCATLVSNKSALSAVCTLEQASWIAEAGSSGGVAHVGGPAIGLKVTGQGCSGLSVSFDIYEWDPTSNDYLTTVKTTFNGDTAMASYTLTKVDFTKGGNEYIGETILFQASVFDSSGSKLGTVGSPQITLLDISTQTFGCVADDSVYTCSSSGKSDCSDAPSCSGKKCYSFDSSYCGQKTSAVTGNSGKTNILGYDYSKYDPWPNVTSIFDLIDKITSFLLTIAIPIAVILIVYAGIILLSSAGNPGKITQAKNTLWYTVIGFSVLLIGKGFFLLIESVLNLGK